MPGQGAGLGLGDAAVRLLGKLEDIALGLVARKSGDSFRVGIFLGFASESARTPHGVKVQMGGRNRIDPRGGGIERLAARTGLGGAGCTIRSIFFFRRTTVKTSEAETRNTMLPSGCRVA